MLPFHEFCGSDEQWSQQSKLIRLLFDCLFSPAAAVAKFGAGRVGKFGCLTRGREMSGWPVREMETCERQELSSSNVMTRIDSCGKFQILLFSVQGAKLGSTTAFGLGSCSTCLIHP